MSAEQSQHVLDDGLLTPGVVDGRAAKQKSKSASRKSSAKKSPASSQTLGESPTSMNGEEKSPGDGTEAAATVAKPKRVRTGCLTCRSRHLKCDEGTPICQNCRKSNRPCERGIRLNFIDTTTPKAPIHLIPPTRDWQVTFQDESREIADEYKGGRAKYAPLEKEDQYDVPQEITYDFSQSIGAPTISHQSLPPVDTVLHTYHEPQQSIYGDNMNGSYHQHHNHTTSVSASHFSDTTQPPTQSYQSTPTIQAEEEQCRPAFETPREVLFMQVFVEEVASWMDSMDAEKHFSELLPFQSLHQPMLRYALLACGGRHMNLINSTQYPDDVALEYYTKANQLFLRLLQNPDRDTALCATTAVILNIYEVMTEKALQRMNHIAGSRALIKDCHWNARSVGIARACFFLNVGLELLSCLHFNWQVAWDPDDWGMDMTMSPQPHSGNEEAWTHKILYILAKVANFKASVPRFREQTVEAEQLRLNKRLQMWMDLKSWCDRWHSCIPPTMHPMAYVPPFQAYMKSSCFPEVWLIKRPTIVARMFYHSAMALLGGIHPDIPMNQDYKDSLEQMKTYHSRQICGIVAHVKDRLVLTCPYSFPKHVEADIHVHVQWRRIRLSPMSCHCRRMPHEPPGARRSPRDLCPHQTRRRLAHPIHHRRLARKVGLDNRPGCGHVECRQWWQQLGIQFLPARVRAREYAAPAAAAAASGAAETAERDRQSLVSKCGFLEARCTL
jgi:Fungal Zn(2)-Cys(6) binuclear cluster domain/Fungal specific transcription factor domain